MDEELLALHYRVRRRENFETAAQGLFELLSSAQKSSPNRPRVLYLDIDGHRNKAGGFDADMLELQREFGLHFLLPFFTKVYFPFACIQNKQEQRNDIPDRLEIFHARNRLDTSLDALYLENESNTEFMSEHAVYTYLRRVSSFLKRYKALDTDYARLPPEPYDALGCLHMWRDYMKELMIELFNSFLHGNLLSVSAMTRSLMECYVYLRIFMREKSNSLLTDWYLCNLFAVENRQQNQDAQKACLDAIKQVCQDCGLDYESAYKRFSDARETSWLSDILPSKQRNFHGACCYLGEPDIYTDFQSASSFVHGQDIRSKLGPFTFYSQIYQRLWLMIHYIAKAIRLYPLREDMEEELQALEDGLVPLAALYHA